MKSYTSKKGGEIGLPTCVHCHVTLLVNSKPSEQWPNVPCLKPNKIKDMPLVHPPPGGWKNECRALTNRVSCGRVHTPSCQWRHDNRAPEAGRLPGVTGDGLIPDAFAL